MAEGKADSVFSHHEPCPKCGSRDAMAIYTDGHGHCFSCSSYVHANGTFTQKEQGRKMNAELIGGGEYRALTKRGISEETCRKWGYQVGKMGDTHVQLANYYHDGVVIAQKVRTPDKDFKFLGETKRVGLYGQWLWGPTKMVVITEGEIDALSVSQLQGNKWPVVSVPNGASSAKKSIQKNLEWLEQFEIVILMLDNDDPGRDAVKECALLFSPGKCRVATLPLKDANEMLLAGRGAEVINAIWKAKPFRPDGVVSFSDIRDAALKPVVLGLPWPWEPLTEATYGRRYGEVYALGAGTGVGKTDVFTQLIEYTALQLNEPCGVLYLEQPVVETARRIAGKNAGKRFHVPDGSWTVEELTESFARLEDSGNVFLYDHFGSSEWETIKARIRYMVVGMGAKHIFLDHLTALAAGADDERKTLELIMSEISGMAQELQFCFYFISHLATPEGKSHEEGGRVMIRHFKGSRAIGFWSHFMFGLERDQQSAKIEDRHTTTFRILKDRYTGQATGKTFRLQYAQDTGLLSVCEGEAEEEGTGELLEEF